MPEMGLVGVVRWWVMTLAATMLVASAVVCNFTEGMHQYNDFKEKGAKQKGAEAWEKAKETSESWASWAKDKLQKGLGLKHHHDEASAAAAAAAKTRVSDGSGRQVEGKAMEMEDTANKAASEKAREVKDAAWEKAREAAAKAASAAEAAFEKVGEVKEKASQHSDQAAETVEEVKGAAKDAGKSAVEKGDEAENHVTCGREATKKKAAETLETAANMDGGGRDDEL
ncbi:hypothetical protein Nepgr_031552 [Nepenthes gracilis]|uniref:Uncharacterized protein n=1 Tax=Nepenthes gracilis TaxID=150966 RepID=A0AAD3TID4_NEPGR|nr:hypothetical protein Nepgr_031552 [Nepenthes gracilis]